MTVTDKIAMVKTLVDNDSEATSEVCGTYLRLAADRMLRRLFPYNPEASLVPAIYDVTQCELAARYFLRRGGEGEIAHSENGVSRTFASVNDEDILSTLTPFIGVVQ